LWYNAGQSEVIEQTQAAVEEDTNFQTAVTASNLIIEGAQAFFGTDEALI